MSTGRQIVATLLMLPFVLKGVLWGIETAIGYWIRKMTQRPAPR